MSTLSNLPLTTITGTPASIADFHGKVFLIVNVASKCGLTFHYTGLEALYQKYKDQGFVVLGFPANDFGAQEPGTDAEIATFCSIDYPVTFPIFSKLVATGPNKHPLYAELTTAIPSFEPYGPWREGLENFSAANGFPPPNAFPELLWNFEKFLIGRDGTILARFAPDTPPEDPKLNAAIAAALA